MTPQLRFPEFIDEWQVKKLGESLESISSGKSNTTSNGTKYPIYGSTGEIGKSATCDYSGDKLLIARVGANAGSMYRVSGSYKVSDNTLIVNLKDDVDTSFVQYSLINFNINRLVFGSGQPLVTGGMLKNTKLAFPSKPEQEKIADFLTAVDERIGVSEKKLELLETYKRGVMQQIFSQQIRFKDESGRPYPDWEEKKLGEVASFVSGYTFLSSTYSESGMYKIITIANVQNGRMNVDKASKINTLPSNIQKNQVLERGDILVSMTGNVGRVCKVNIENCLLNQRVGKIVTKNINADFLFAVLNSRRFLAEMESLAQGGAQGNLSSKDIMRYMIKLPSRDEQQKIADFLTTLDEKFTAEKSKLTATRKFKKALLQRMFV